jgi:hypothetical protein
MVEVINEDTKKSPQAKQTLIKSGDNYYIISDNGSEVLVFNSDKDGNITDWCEVGSFESIEDAINGWHKMLNLSHFLTL